jgi:hypothetical protein
METASLAEITGDLAYAKIVMKYFTVNNISLQKIIKLSC